MAEQKIVYTFRFPDADEAVFEIVFDDEAPASGEPGENLPEWTRLGFHQCPHCPLAEADHPNCPLAAAISRAISRFEDTLSYEVIDLEVEAPNRTVTAQASAQVALGSLLGLIMATSGCPHTDYFRPMARFHLPLANEHETVYRATSMYLLAQYFLVRQGAAFDADLSGLKAIYETLQTLNRAMADRVRQAIKRDAPVNAIVVLDFFAQSLPFEIEDQLDSLEPLFSHYLKHPPSTETTDDP